VIEGANFILFVHSERFSWLTIYILALIGGSPWRASFYAFYAKLSLISVPGGTYFFTVNLLERRQDTLVCYIYILCEAVRKTRRKWPFHIDACGCYRITCTVFGRYLLVMMIFPIAGNRSRFALCKRFLEPSGDPRFVLRRVSGVSGNVASGNTLSVMMPIMNITSITGIEIQ
jgi:hypothetical protein